MNRCGKDKSTYPEGTALAGMPFDPANGSVGKYSPLIGVDVTLLNNMTMKLQYNKSRVSNDLNLRADLSLKASLPPPLKRDSAFLLVFPRYIQRALGRISVLYCYPLSYASL